MNKIRFANLIFTSLGVLVFSGLIIYLTRFPDDFNIRVQNIAIHEVSNRFDAMINRHGQNERVEQLKSLTSKLSGEIEANTMAAQDWLENNADEFVVDVLAANCELNCENRELARASVEKYFQMRMGHLKIGQAKIEQAIKDEFSSVLKELRADLNIFALSNTGLFLAAFLLSIFKGRASAHLLPVSLSLAGASMLASYLYIFQQDWLHAVLFNSYWGWSYLTLAGVLAIGLADIAMNRARVTTHVINFVLNAVGSAVSVLPC